MIRFKQFLLAEAYSPEKTWQNFGNKIKSYMDSSKDDHEIISRHKAGEDVSSHIIKHLEKGDPTPQKKYMPHIAGMYAKGGMPKLEDVGRLHSALSSYHELSKRNKLQGDDKMLHKQSSLTHFEDIADKYKDHLSKKEEKASAHDEMKKQATITKHDTFTHIVPHTEAASCHFGKGTRWCTAAENNNMFKYYSDRGPLHIYVPHNPAYTGEKYQFHHSSKSLMNEKDKRVSLTKLPHPEIVDHIKKYRRDIRKLEKTAHPDVHLDHPELSVRATAIKHPNATAEHITKALGDEDINIRRAAIEHPKATAEHITKALGDENWAIRVTAIKHPKATAEHITKALGDEDGVVRRAAIEHPKATAEHITKALGDKFWPIRRAAIEHPKATAEHITKALGDENGVVRRAAIEHPKATAEHITKALRDRESHIRDLAMEIKNKTQ